MTSSNPKSDIGGPTVEAANKLISERLSILRGRMNDHGVEALLISSPENRRYFSGFSATDPMLTESSGRLLILPNKQYLLTDGRYVQAAADEAPLYEVVAVGLKGYAHSLASLISEGTTIYGEAEYTTVFFQQWAQQYLAKLGRDLRMAGFDPSEQRKIKDPAEISLIAEALSITEKAIALLWEELEAGWTEERAAFYLDSKFRELGGQGPSFETIFASGPQAALPHAVPGKKTLAEGEMAVMDCGARFEGYASDITRTFACGQVDEEQKKIYRAVREAQLRAIEAIAPGKMGQDIDAVARESFRKVGLESWFNHSLGHGVGLAVHESPSLKQGSREVLAPGMVVTVEPGLYLPHKVGVRLEQLVVVTENGCRLLNHDEHFYDF
ncbi:MAG: aminopeptidase P family protein [Deltaproteobacteria bacterium]|nr:aminopeptidase P family protein [Deltaproteobacteria bacterium]